MKIGILFILVFLTSCDGKSTNSIDVAFDKGMTIIEPCIGYILAVMFGLYSIKFIWDMFFGDD